MIILYAFLSQLRRSWFSSVCVSVCVCVSVRPRVRICGSAPWKRFVPSLSLSVSSNTSVSIFCVQRSAFSATTRCTVQSVSLTKHDQDNKKKIINANLPNSAFVSVRGSVFFLRFAVLFLSVCKRYSTHVTFSLLHCFKRSLFKFFFCFVLLIVSFFYCFSLFLNFCPFSGSTATTAQSYLKSRDNPSRVGAPPGRGRR